MKVAVLLVCSVVIIKKTSCAAIHAPLDIISLDDISESDRKTLEYLDQRYPRPKRSHPDVFSSLKAAVGNGIKSKLGLIAKGSASAVSHFSTGSSGHGDPHTYHHYDVPETYDHKSFDFWSLKKSILNTLLQAVKAIKGGVIAIKGQLIKGSGYLISAKGKLISAKGEAITSLGKNIASSAILSPYPHHHSAPAHIEYVAPHAHYASSPHEEYSAPSAPGPDYVAPDHHHAHHHEDKPDPEHAGILILKKIPTEHDHHEHDNDHHHHSDEHVPDFKPLAPTGPSFGTIVGKFFSASTSLKPGEPTPFGDSGPGETSYHAHHEYELHDHHHDDHHHHDNHFEEHHHVEHDQYDAHLPPTSHKHVEFYPSAGGGEPTGPQKAPSGPSLPTAASGPSAPASYGPPSASDGGDLKPPSTSYGTPFEDAPSYLNYAEYTSESKKQPTTLIKNASKPSVYNEIRPLSQVLAADSSLLTNSYEKAKLFVASQSNKPNDLFSPYPTPLVSSVTPTVYNLENFAQFGGFKNPSAADPSDTIKYLSPPASPLYYPKQNFHSPGFNVNNSPSFKYNSQRNNKIPSAASLKFGPQRFHRSKLTVSGHKKPGIDVVRSIAFELGPNGPKRL